MTSSKRRRKELPSCLTRNLLHHPSLLTELPSLLHSLDEGGAPVSLDKFDASTAAGYIEIFELLGVQRFRLGEKVVWGLEAEENGESLKKLVFTALLDSGTVLEPWQLSSLQSGMTLRAAQAALLVMEKAPLGFLEDLVELLDDLLEEGAVSLADHEEPLLLGALEKLLQTLELREENEQYSLPEDSAQRRRVEQATEELLRGLRAGLSSVSATARVPVGASERSDTSSHQADSVAPIIGPSRPTPQQQHIAQQLSSREDEDEDEAGPMLASDLPADQPLLLLRAPEASRAQPSPENVREEWMLTPGERNPFDAAKDVFGKNRQFQSGKTAKKQAEALAAMKEASQSEEAKQEAARTQKVLDEYRELRGPSLMELHLDKKGDRAADAPSQRKAFDRERDLLASRPMGRKDALALVEQAKLLDSRFDKGSVQKSFL